MRSPCCMPSPSSLTQNFVNELLFFRFGTAVVEPRCPELNTSLWYFMHIPKAGGSAFGECQEHQICH